MDGLNRVAEPFRSQPEHRADLVAECSDMFGCTIKLRGIRWNQVLESRDRLGLWSGWIRGRSHVISFISDLFRKLCKFALNILVFIRQNSELFILRLLHPA